MNHIEKAEAVFKTLAQLARETWKRKENLFRIGFSSKSKTYFEWYNRNNKK